ncbi:ABC transporter substrate-binding protein [Candidatus Odyssella acanthamoebae]|uniref:ABC transporter substrate-binding protein n=1 Tax=Candidatus Odyssella acanthamoebae TaxID=91604 RepID=UPI00068A39E0|nr:ABC transporter substrate-binding protein [Candidatus Paracaedibacter acanthamoebae]
MKKLLSLALITSLLMGCKKEEANAPKEPNKLIIGLSADYPPFEYFKNGKIVGFDVALMEALTKKLGVDVEFKDMNFDGIIGALQTKRIDAAISSISASEDRKQAVDFTNTYYSGGIAMVCSKESDVATILDLKGTTIGLQAGSVYEPYANDGLKNQLGELTIKSLPKIPDLIQDLKSKRIVCILMGTTEAKRLALEQPDLKAIPISGSETEVAIALPKGSALKDKLNTALAEMKADGSLDKLIQEWLK